MVGVFKSRGRLPDGFMRWEPIGLPTTKRAGLPVGHGPRPFVLQEWFMVSSASSSADLAFGFLTVCDASGVGTFGGYLLVDLSGRPLEFHCTAPVRVTRAQQILYGASLQRHLHGEQIGGPLLKATALTPAAVLTDLDSLLHARSHGGSPVAVVREGAMVTADDEASGAFALGGVRVQPHDVDRSQAEQLQTHLAELAQSIELVEPFARIRAAIDEAQRHS